MLWIQLRKLRGTDVAARTRAAHALAERGSPKAVEPLGEALGDRNWDERAAAAVALGTLGNGRGVPYLAESLSSDVDLDVRCSAAWALGRIGGKSVLEPLGAALDDRDESVRRVATEAIAKVGTALALESLKRARRDPDHDVRLAAIRGLGDIGRGTIADELLDALGDTEWSVRCAAAESLARLEDSSALPALVAALGSGSLPAQLASAEALGRIGDPGAVEALCESVRGNGAPTGGEHTASEATGDLRLRRNVAKALGDIGKAAALPALIPLAADRYSAGAAIESVAKVLRWDAANAELDSLRALSAIDDAQQVPWMVDEAEEAASGRVVVREGKPWPVDAAELRSLADTELRRRGHAP